MEIRIECQGIQESPWMRQYLESKLARLERYLSPGSQIQVCLVTYKDVCFTRFRVTTLRHEYAFEKEGDDIYEAFTSALEEASMTLRREHLKIRQKFHHQFLDFTEP